MTSRKNSKIAMIFVPGLSDHRFGQKFIADKWAWFWQAFGIKPYYYSMKWIDKQPFKTKLDGLLQLIDSLHQQGYSISLVGSSAGASAVINAFDLRKDKLNKIIYICGMIHGVEKINEQTKKDNPAFYESLNMLSDALLRLSPKDRQRILSIYPLFDGRVPVPDTRLQGVHQKLILTIGHALSILWALTCGGYLIVRFIKK